VAGEVLAPALGGLLVDGGEELLAFLAAQPLLHLARQALRPAGLQLGKRPACTNSASPSRCTSGRCRSQRSRSSPSGAASTASSVSRLLVSTSPAARASRCRS